MKPATVVLAGYLAGGFMESFGRIYTFAARKPHPCPLRGLGCGASFSYPYFAERQKVLLVSCGHPAVSDRRVPRLLRGGGKLNISRSKIVYYTSEFKTLAETHSEDMGSLSYELRGNLSLLTGTIIYTISIYILKIFLIKRGFPSSL